MTNLQTIQQDIAALPPDTQQIIFDLVEVLKTCKATETQLTSTQPSTYEKIKATGFIGSVAIEEEL